MSQRKKQNKVLYMCLIMLIVTASVLVAISSGVGRRVEPEQSAKQTEKVSTVKKSNNNEDAAGTRLHETEKQNTEDGDSSQSTQDAASPDTSAEPVSISLSDIDFVAPSDGYVIVPCSITQPVYSITMNDYRCHTGLDISSAIGDAVRACANGVVSEIYDDPMMGTTVVISHAEGIQSVYKNLAEETPENITVGTSVSAGDTIGCVGESALIECEEEPHFHFELMVNGEHVDPSEYISVSSIDSVFED